MQNESDHIYVAMRQNVVRRLRQMAKIEHRTPAAVIEDAVECYRELYGYTQESEYRERFERKFGRHRRSRSL